MIKSLEYKRIGMTVAINQNTEKYLDGLTKKREKKTTYMWCQILKKITLT